MHKSVVGSAAKLTCIIVFDVDPLEWIGNTCIHIRVETPVVAKALSAKLCQVRLQLAA